MLQVNSIVARQYRKNKHLHQLKYFILFISVPSPFSKDPSERMCLMAWEHEARPSLGYKAIVSRSNCRFSGDMIQRSEYLTLLATTEKKRWSRVLKTSVRHSFVCQRISDNSFNKIMILAHTKQIQQNTPFQHVRHHKNAPCSLYIQRSIVLSCVERYLYTCHNQ